MPDQLATTPQVAPYEPVDPHVQASQPDVFEPRRVRRRRWPRFLVFAVVGVGAALGVIYLALPPRVYSASTLLKVAATQPRVYFTTSEPQTDFDTYRRTQVVHIRSRPVLNTALRNPMVAELEVIRKQHDPVEWLAKRVGIDFVAGSEIMRISVSGNSDEDLVTLANAVTDAYLTEVVNKEQNDRLRRIDQLKAVLAAQQKGLRHNRKLLHSLKEAAGVPTSPLEEQALLQKLGDCQRELRRVQLAEAAARARVARLQQAPAASEPRKAVADLEEEIATLAEQQKILRSEEEQLIARLRKAEKAAYESDWSSQQEEIARAEEVARSLGAEIERLEVELKAPARVVLLETARVLRD
jgi:uncharacterized protein involved in exopolysaccharide biosynthesis